MGDGAGAPGQNGAHVPHAGHRTAGSRCAASGGPVPVSAEAVGSRVCGRKEAFRQLFPALSGTCHMSLVRGAMCSK